MGKKSDKKKDSHEVRAAKLEVDKLELSEKLKKKESETNALAVSLCAFIFVTVIFAVSVL